MESFKHTCERDGARQGCLGRTDALRRADAFSPNTNPGASSRRGPGDPPSPGPARLQDCAARPRELEAAHPARERTCPVSGRIPEPRSTPSVASGGPRRRAGGGSLAGGAGLLRGPHTSVALLPAFPDPAGLRTGAHTQLDSSAGQSRAGSAG